MKNRVQFYRWEKGWSIEQLARHAKIDKSTICRVENGKIESPSVDIAFALADALGVDVRELFFQ